jgi:hypothetical protein
MAAGPRQIEEVPPIGEDSFLFRDIEPFEEGYYPERPDAPLTLASQARTLEWALERVRGTAEVSSAIGYAQYWAHEMAQATLVANTSAGAAEIHEMQDDPRCMTVVFKDGGRVVIGPSLEAETDAIIDLSVADIRAVQESYDLAAAIPDDKSKGSGAEILEVLPEDVRVIAIAALQAMLRSNNPSGRLSSRPVVREADGGDKLFTHSADKGADTAGEYFADEAGIILRSAGYLPEATARGRLANSVHIANAIPRSIRRVSALAMAFIHHH